MPETTAPVRTPVPTREPSIVPGPDRYFSPDRLCPNQKKDGGGGARPL